MRLWGRDPGRVDFARCREDEHEWEYFDDRAENPDYTGYLERCKRCGLIVQVPQ